MKREKLIFGLAFIAAIIAQILFLRIFVDEVGLHGKAIIRTFKLYPRFLLPILVNSGLITIILYEQYKLWQEGKKNLAKQISIEIILVTLFSVIITRFIGMTIFGILNLTCVIIMLYYSLRTRLLKR